MTGEDTAAAAEKARRAVDAATWVAIGLGLAFTAVNVQTFAAAGAGPRSLGWCAAWLLDPMVSVLLLAVVRAEQVTARWQVLMPWQVTATKWAAFAATYAMNTWAFWRDGVPSGVVLHSVPPVFVLLAAEVAPALRDRLTEAARIAAAAWDVATTAAGSHGAATPTAGRAVDGGSDEAPPPTDPDEVQLSRDDEIQGGDVGDRLGVGRGGGPAASTGSGPNRQVVELARRLAGGERLSGPKVAAALGCSERNARRLLAEARELDAPDAVADTERGERDRSRRALHVIGRTS